jgi:hypothetical protein
MTSIQQNYRIIIHQENFLYNHANNSVSVEDIKSDLTKIEDRLNSFTPRFYIIPEYDTLESIRKDFQDIVKRFKSKSVLQTELTDIKYTINTLGKRITFKASE